MDETNGELTESERRSRCRELARTGETKCKLGQVKSGVMDLEEAFNVGTSDLKLLSIVCSQLGNAYIELQDYGKAVSMHQEDRALSTILGDVSGEAKACCNLACAYRLLGCYTEAIDCSEQCVQLCRKLQDKEKEALAMYSLATCYHMRAKEVHLAELNEERLDGPVESTLYIAKAVKHYLCFLRLLDDMPKPPNYNTLRGRTLGNLGNLHYLLNNIDESISFHTQRLDIAVIENDQEAIIRAHSNIGNAHLVGGDPVQAEQHYCDMQAIAEKLDDQQSITKALFGLATAFSLQKNYTQALLYYTQMHKLVTKQQDEGGQLKSLFGLTFANRALGSFKMARDFAQEHFKCAERIGDVPSMELAQSNIDALSELLMKSPPVEVRGTELEKKPSHVLRSTSSLSDQTPRPSQIKESSKKLETMRASPNYQGMEPSSSLLAALAQANRSRIDEQRAPAPNLSFRSPGGEQLSANAAAEHDGLQRIRSNTLGSADSAKTSALSKMKALRRNRSPRTVSKSAASSGASSMNASPAGSRSHSPARGSVMPALAATLLHEHLPVTKDRRSLAGSSGEEMGLTDFLDSLGNQGAAPRPLSSPPLLSEKPFERHTCLRRSSSFSELSPIAKAYSAF